MSVLQKLHDIDILVCKYHDYVSGIPAPAGKVNAGSHGARTYYVLRGTGYDEISKDDFLQLADEEQWTLTYCAGGGNQFAITRLYNAMCNQLRINSWHTLMPRADALAGLCDKKYHYFYKKRLLIEFNKNPDMVKLDSSHLMG